MILPPALIFPRGVQQTNSLIIFESNAARYVFRHRLQPEPELSLRPLLSYFPEHTKPLSARLSAQIAVSDLMSLYHPANRICSSHLILPDGASSLNIFSVLHRLLLWNDFRISLQSIVKLLIINRICFIAESVIPLDTGCQCTS